MTNHGFEPNDDFAHLALLPGGIYGGNPGNPRTGEQTLWFCGIEFAPDKSLDPDTGVTPPSRALEIPGLERPVELPYWTEDYLDKVDAAECVTKRPRAVATWQFIQKVARIALAFEGRPEGPEAPDITAVQEYIESELCRPAEASGSTCYLNLFPVDMARADDGSWNAEAFQRTGFINKTLYRAWCMEHRLPIFRALAAHYKPKAIVCAGSTFEREFRLAFLPRHQHWDEGESVEIWEGKRRKTVRLIRINDGATTLALTPFLGQGGMMANESLRQVGALLRDR
jgi:hypothetical protein